MKQQQNEVKMVKKGVELTKYLGLAKTLTMLLYLLEHQERQSYQTFIILYNGLSKQIKQLIIFQVINYHIWCNEKLPIQIRERTQFFKMISNWIVEYEIKVEKIKELKQQFEFISLFFRKQTKNVFERVVLMDEIYQDLLELLGDRFWKSGTILGDKESQVGKEQRTGNADKWECQQILKLLEMLITYYSQYQNDQQIELYNCELFILKNKHSHYNSFILKAIEYILSVNGGKKDPQQYLEKNQQMNLTKLALVFLQRGDVGCRQSVKVIQLLMERTSKAVRFAMVVDYVRYYDYLEKMEQQEIIQEVENMPYFRELIIGKVQINDAGLISTSMGHQLGMIHIGARSKQRLLISHQRFLYGLYSVLELQVLIESGDISLSIYQIKGEKQMEYWKEERTQDRRINIVLKEQGIYIIQFDNSYSWLKPKSIRYRLEQYCTGDEQ